jgi:putative transposase
LNIPTNCSLSDGETERRNRTVEQVLREFINLNQDNWVELLPSVEFALNSTIQDGTQQTPMKLISGHDPILPMTFLNPQVIQFQSQSLEEFMTSRSNAIASAKDNLKLAQDYMAAYTNRSRQDVQFDVGDMVFVHNNALRTPLERTQTCNNLKSVWHGPYR